MIYPIYIVKVGFFLRKTGIDTKKDVNSRFSN